MCAQPIILEITLFYRYTTQFYSSVQFLKLKTIFPLFLAIYEYNIRTSVFPYFCEERFKLTYKRRNPIRFTSFKILCVSQLTHLSVFITYKCNTQNIDILKNSLLKRQNNMWTVLISFITVIVKEWHAAWSHAQVYLLAIYRWVNELHVMGAVLPTTAGRAPKSSDFNSTLKRDRILWNWKNEK